MKISNLPITINTERNSFAPLDKEEKLSTGPSDPIDGPTFPSAVAIAPNELLNGVGSLIKKNDITKTPSPNKRR